MNRLFPPLLQHYQTFIIRLFLHLKAEFAFADHLGFAITFNRSVLSYIETYYKNVYNTPILQTNNIQIKVITVNARINYHFLYRKKIDPFAGIGFGLRNNSIKSGVNTVSAYPYKFPYGFEATAGLRALIASAVGVFLEAGISRSLIQGGITVNFGGFKNP